MVVIYTVQAIGETLSAEAAQESSTVLGLPLPAEIAEHFNFWKQDELRAGNLDKQVHAWLRLQETMKIVTLYIYRHYKLVVDRPSQV